MFRTLFAEEARTQLARNAAVTGACCLILLGFLGMWWLLTDVPALAGLMQVASMVVIIAIPVVVMVQVAVEYWQSMYGQRGYLTMAVPVRGRVHFAAKALYACVVVLVEGVICLGGLIAWLAVFAHSIDSTTSDVLRPVLWAIETAGAGKTTLFILLVLIGLFSLVIEVGAVMSIGGQGRFNHLGFGAPMVGLVLLYAVNQVLALIAVLFVPLSMDVTTGDFTSQMMWPQFLEALRTGAQPSVIGVGSVAIGPVLAGVLTWWAVRAIEQHTSLR